MGQALTTLGCLEDKTPVVVDEAAELAYQLPLGEPVATNPRVYLDMDVGGKALGRIVIELKADKIPKTVRRRIPPCAPRLIPLHPFVTAATRAFDVSTLPIGKRWKISGACAPARRASDTKAAPSTASSPTSCARAATSPATMAPGERASGEASSRTRTSICATRAPASSPVSNVITGHPLAFAVSENLNGRPFG